MLTITSIAIYFIHPNGKLKLSFDLIYFRESPPPPPPPTHMHAHRSHDTRHTHTHTHTHTHNTHTHTHHTRATASTVSSFHVKALTRKDKKSNSFPVMSALHRCSTSQSRCLLHIYHYCMQISMQTRWIGLKRKSGVLNCRICVTPAEEDWLVREKVSCSSSVCSAVHHYSHDYTSSLASLHVTTGMNRTSPPAWPHVTTAITARHSSHDYSS